WDEVSLFGKFALDDVFKCSESYSRRVDDGHYHALKMMEELIEKSRSTPLNLLSNRDDNLQDCNDTASTNSDGFFKKIIKKIFIY
ncbi:MAG: hypothetical protein HQK68_04095, partial [Desulfamplus sp.]|nr:hypothetical protein [Desulfamplus sp.]